MTIEGETTGISNLLEQGGAMGLAFLLTLGLGLLLERVAGVFGWTGKLFEESREVEGMRRLGERETPLIGGLAIFLALLLLSFAVESFVFSATSLSTAGVWAGFGSAFALGLVDDCIGLTPGRKFCGQALVGLALVLPSCGMDPAALNVSHLAWIVGAVVAQNAINTFDNADGVATSLVGPCSLRSSARWCCRRAGLPSPQPERVEEWPWEPFAAR